MNKLELLNPQNAAVIFIDFQPQMVFGVASIDYGNGEMVPPKE
jgi:nicotinamidase-related amidase